MAQENIFHLPAIDDSKELKEIYLSVAIRAFAFSIVSVFVPLYLMSLGYSFNDALVFLIIYFGALVFIAPLSGYLSTKIGIKHVSFLGPLVTIIYLLLLFALASIDIPISVVALAGSFGIGLYWIPINSHFAKHSHSDHSGRETSILFAVARTVSAAGPVFGGFLIMMLGFSWSFVMASVIMLGAMFPFFMSSDYKSRFKYRFREMFVKKNLPYFDDFIFHGMLFVATMVIFPIYIFMISSNYEITGIAASASAAGIALSAFIVGKYTDRKSKLGMMRIGGALNLAMWAFLMFVKIPIAVYISSFFVGFFAYSIAIPLFASFCDRLGEHEHTEFMTFREIAMSVGKVAFLFILLFFTIETKFIVAFALAAIASLYFIFADLG